MSDDVAVNFFEYETQNCPYDAYTELRDEAPVWLDPHTGMYVITRYEDLRAVLLDTETFISGGDTRRRVQRPEMIERGRRIHQLYTEKGWVPARTLAGRDDPNHKQMRALFDHAFRPSKIKLIDPWVEERCHLLIDDFISTGSCDWVKQFAVPLPLLVIGKQMGAKEQDIWRIKAWTDAWVQRLGLMQTDEEAIWSTEMEIEAQHYFQPIFERVRNEPDDSLLSDIVNTVIPEWGRTLTDEELHAEMMADTFVGGSETSTNALSEGARILAEQPDVWARLKADPDGLLPTFVEEVLRLEGPVQGLFRTAAKDVEMHGVTIPAGATINVRFAAANRDERTFACPADVDLERKSPKQHLAFGVGTHYCLGAPLARRELILGFKALLARVDRVWLAPDRNDFKHAPNFCLRALKELHLGFEPASA
jgi:cytochrome P450